MITILLLLALWAAPQEPPKLKLKVVETFQCHRVESIQPRSIGLDCGKDADGKPIVLDIPETVYQFPSGTVFVIERMSDSSERFAEKQPKGSVVIKTPPCPQERREKGYQRPPLQLPPCDPDIEPE